MSLHTQNDDRGDFVFFLFLRAYREKKNRLRCLPLFYLIDFVFNWHLFSIAFNYLLAKWTVTPKRHRFCVHICFVILRERVRTPGIAQMLDIAEKQQFHRKFRVRRKRIWEYRCCFVLCTLSPRRRMRRLYYAGSVWYKQISIEREKRDVLTYDNMRTMMC